MKRIYLFLIIFTLALCSIVYELILAQTLTVFLHNTVLRYSITIGLYLFALGIGALMAEGKLMHQPLMRLQQVELLLSVIGGFSVIFLFLIEMFTGEGWVFNIIAHGFILGVGFLSGWEIPLLIRLSQDKNSSTSENMVLAVNYTGAFIGTVIFAFIFYPRVGLIPAALITGMLNAIAGVCLNSVYNKEKFDQNLWLAQIIVLILILYYVFQADVVTQYFINHYLVFSTEKIFILA